MFKVVCVGAFHRKGIELLESRPDLVTYEVLTDLSPENVARGVAGADAVVVRTTPLPRETLERADHLRIDTHQDNLPMQGASIKAGFERAGVVYVSDGTPRVAFDWLREA